MAKFAVSMGIFLVILLFTQSAFGLQCYVCNSAMHVDCNLSSPAEKYRVDCSLEKPSSEPQLRTHEIVQTEKNSESESESNNGTVPAALPTQDENATGFGAQDLNDEHPASNRTRPSRSVAENKDDVGQSFFTVLPVKLSKEATFCRKIVNHIPAQVNGPDSKLGKQVRIVRSCGFAPEKGIKEELTCKWMGTEGIQKEYCACAGDGCNSGNYLDSLKAHTMILFSVMSLGYFYIL